MTIFELLDKTERPYYRYGTVPADTHPGFYTFNQIDTVEILSTDNDIQLKADVFDVVYYTDEPADIYTPLDDFCRIARVDGWTLKKLPRDIATDRPNVYGRLARLAKIDYNTIRA
jgi:hypothetical protein